MGPNPNQYWGDLLAEILAQRPMLAPTLLLAPKTLSAHTLPLTREVILASKNPTVGISSGPIQLRAQGALLTLP